MSSKQIITKYKDTMDTLKCGRLFFLRPIYRCYQCNVDYSNHLDDLKYYGYCSQCLEILFKHNNLNFFDTIKELCKNCTRQFSKNNSNKFIGEQIWNKDKNNLDREIDISIDQLIEKEFIYLRQTFFKELSYKPKTKLSNGSTIY